MAENLPPSLPPNNDVPGLPFYEKSRAHLRDLVRKQQQLQRTLAHQEETIYKKETDYLEDTPQGNIILGFENYTKGGGALAGGRRGGQRVVEGNRVFSRSSVSFVPGGGDSPSETAQSTPGNSAQTPVSSATFLKGDGAATPTSATSGNKLGTLTVASKKNKKGPSAAGAGDDSETDGKENGNGGNKKARTAFGSVRK